MDSGMLLGNTVPMFQYEPRDTASVGPLGRSF